MACCVAVRAGSLVRLSVPKWNTLASSISEYATSPARRQVSAPGLRAKLNSRLPVASSVTKASVVNTAGSATMPRVSMPFSATVRTSSWPKLSAPTLPISAVLQP